ncbi:MAG: DnaK suppressor protein [Solirubrobacterales bacterium]|jgi:DnaK suppressor protein|nr:DnaK suppressor protein [Solirubrobacterales bacterium]MEA2619615.1 DnaK suppressor protein [Chloroflexota bacterium]
MDDDRAKELLAVERKRIEDAMAALNREGPGATADEPGDQDSENLYQAETDAGRAEELAEELAAVERAEARLAEGKFGISVVSGEPIPDKRLEALPTADRTVDELE